MLPAPLRDALERVGAGLARRNVSPADVDTLVAGLGAMPLPMFDRAAREIFWRAGLYRQPARIKPSASWLSFFPGAGADTSHRDALRRVPGLAYPMLFHGDGYLREAGLTLLSGPLPNAFFLVALIHRLNDWVPEVRAAAAAALARAGPSTDVAVIAEAMLFLLPRTGDWGRWADQSTALASLLNRPEVAEAVATAIGSGVTGPMPRVLRHALRSPILDRHLIGLLREARQPAVRALALKVLTEGVARWAFGPCTQKKWIDKSMGRFVNVRAEAERPLASALPLRALIEIGAGDKAAPVRLAAVTALARRYDEIPDARPLAESLAEDRSRAVRARAAYLLR